MLREFTLILLILFILSGSVYGIQLKLAPQYDPPSIYNYGGGGYTRIYLSLAESGFKVYHITNFNELSRFNPSTTVLIIASPDKPVEEDSVENVISWVRKGGLVLALDEIGTLNPLANSIGFRIGSIISSVSLGECLIENHSFPLYVNVYSPLISLQNMSLEGLEVIGRCYAEGFLIGVLVRIGIGRIFLLGDSSILINSMIRYNKTTYNIILLRTLIGERDSVVFYEGGREYIFIDTRVLLDLVRIPLSFLAYILGSVMNSDLLAGILLFTFISTLFLFIYLRRYVTFPSY
ncbi:MAG: DUF4350 domain-containing protein, partial [Sulfolobales archaeon]